MTGSPGEGFFSAVRLPTFRKGGSWLRLIDPAGDDDPSLAENVRDLRVAEARSVVFEGEVIVLLVNTKAPQAVGVGEFAETAKLLEAERRLEFVGDFEECHKEKYKVKR